jgi:uncharacterized Zn finger protein
MAFRFAPYVPVAARRRQAALAIERFRKKGQESSPVVIEGRTIARTFWGQSWCRNLERYSDYSNRLPRGRTYVRNGSVVDLQLARGQVKARVAGSSLYAVTVEVTPLPRARWTALCRSCAGGIDSLVELLQGRLSKGVMEKICAEKSGLFPSPAEIRFSCSCPDWAVMCKHVAAVLYGVGARLDARPELLFGLRGVDGSELIARAGRELSLAKVGPRPERALAEEGLSELFGIDLAEAPASIRPPRNPKGAVKFFHVEAGARGVKPGPADPARLRGARRR